MDISRLKSTLDELKLIIDGLKSIIDELKSTTVQINRKAILDLPKIKKEFSMKNRHKATILSSALLYGGLNAKNYESNRMELVTMLERILNEYEDSFSLQFAANKPEAKQGKTLWQKAVAGFAALVFGTSFAMSTPSAAQGAEALAGGMPPGYEEKQVDYESMAKQMENLNAAKKFNQVITEFGTYANDENNKSGLYFNELGFAYKLKKEFGLSITYLEKAAKIRDNPQTLYNLVSAYNTAGNKKEAIMHARKLVELFPTYEYSPQINVWLKKNE